MPANRIGFATDFNLTNSKVGIGTADPNNFTEYSNITKDTVISWLESSLNAVEENEELSTLQKSLIQNIESQRNPPIVNLGLPWEDTTSPN